MRVGKGHGRSGLLFGDLPEPDLGVEIDIAIGQDDINAMPFQLAEAMAQKRLTSALALLIRRNRYRRQQKDHPVVLIIAHPREQDAGNHRAAL